MNRLRLLLAFLAVASIGLLGYAVWVEPVWLKVSEHEVIVSSGTQPIKILQLSDLHIKKLGSFELDIIHEVKKAQPEIIVLSGDVIDDKKSINVLAEFLSLLPNVKKIATLGNWEHWAEIELTTLKDVYKINGVELLSNDCSSFSRSDRSLAILGLDDYGAGEIDIALGLKKCPEKLPIILVQHSPQFFDEVPDGFEKQVTLSLSGHTHGGQVTFGGYAIYTPPASGKYVRGWYETKWGRLYVSSGIGTSVIPFRFGSRPEISIFLLR